MKVRNILAALLLMVAGLQTAQAQKIKLYFTDDSFLELSLSDMKCIECSEEDVVVHEYVDLGLPSRTLWATCNIGASSPEEYGDYFAWGETKPKETYSWENYKYCNGSQTTIFKYIGLDNKVDLETADDAAAVNWGRDWQMPSEEQIKELFTSSYTTTEWTTQNGKNGYMITSKSNGRCLFLPAGGYRGNTIDGEGSAGIYWSRSRSRSFPENSGCLFFNSGSIYFEKTANQRSVGLNVRPVRYQYTPPVQFVTSIVLSETSLTLNVGETKTLTATVQPIDATNKSVGWSSSDYSVADVDEETGEVTAKATGTCVITCYAKDGSYVKAHCDVTVHSDPIIDREYVDLGLPSGTLWATCNVGAENPEDYGNMYAWGETEPKDEYSIDTYTFFNSSDDTFSRYNADDYLIELDPADDAATANWGSEWQMPSIIQFRELLNSKYTTAEWTTLNGKNGFKITSNNNGKSIFLPAAGHSVGTQHLEEGGRVWYWSRSLDRDDYLDCAFFVLLAQGNDFDVNLSTSRARGFSVRPVRVQEKKEHEYVDLGLPSGTLWATCNIGAESPDGYGDLFAWGEIEPKDVYRWSNYKWMNEGQSNLRQINKYTFIDGMTMCCWYMNDEFIGDDKRVLKPVDDAATMNWGIEWQTPSVNQLSELINSKYTTTEWTTQNSVNGFKITSKVNGNSIFLPAAGYRYETPETIVGSVGYYWSRSLYKHYSYLSYYVYFQSSGISTTYDERHLGMSIRPVRVPEKKEREYVDLNLPSGTLWATCNVGANSPEEYGHYFAWGETEPKEEYNWETYMYCHSEGLVIKYCTQSEYGFNGVFTDDKTELLPEDDAATVNWGSEWQMPSEEQCNELINSDYTTTEWTYQNGVKGCVITSKSNGNTIFLPAAGSRWNDESRYVGSHGYYWSRSLSSNESYYSYCLGVYSGDNGIYNGDRGYGFNVRPVRKKN